ncbi:MAG: hypothetical protein JSU04_17235 [Bdellovibrionales bacterium]|nr:hypothetical protein [Bdellovibrionales bacterium]
MKNILMILVLSLSAVFAHAQYDGGFIRPGRPGAPGRYPDPGRGGYGNVQCTATDKGWEEHWGGHGSCGECLRKHGDCIETCSRSYYVCQAQGIDRNGRTYVSEGRADSRYQAEDEAMRACYYYRYQNCRVTNCNQNSETVSRRSCR